MSVRINPAVIFLAVMVVLTGGGAFIGIPVTRITEIAIYALFGAGINLLLAYTGLLPFGAALFFGLSAYVSALTSLHLFGTELIGLSAGVVFSVVVGAVVGVIVLARSGIYFALLTLALSQLAYEIAFKWTSVTGGENGLQNVPRTLFDTNWSFHCFVIASVTVCLYIIWRIAHSPAGRVFQAIRDNELRAKAMGYNTFVYRWFSFVIMAGLVGYAGGLLTYFLGGAYANPLSWQHAGDPILMTVFGGVSHFLGPLWGAIVFIALQDRLSAVFENWWLVFAPIVLLFALFAPNGLHGIFQRLTGLGRSSSTLTRRGIPERPQTIKKFVSAGGCGDDPEKPILSIRGLSKRFGSLEVAKNIDLDIMPRTVHSLIGPNGAGKTTFFNMLSGILPPSAGTVCFKGRDISKTSLHARVRLGIARSFQIISLFENLTVFETVRLGVQVAHKLRFSVFRDAYAIKEINEKTWSILDVVGLVDRAAEMSADLSHGEQRMLDIAVTLSTEGSILLLDEPLAGLSESDRVKVAELIRTLAKSLAVFVIEHDIDRVVAMSDRMSVLHQGVLIAEGHPAEVARDPAVAAAYLGSFKLATEKHGISTPRHVQFSTKPLLNLEGVSAGYDKSIVVDDLNLEVREGEVVALLGRNGAGKTTTLRAISGINQPTSGRIVFNDAVISGLQPYEINRRGIALVPEGRRLFPNLTVLENLRIARRSGGATLGDAYEIFPKLKLLTDSPASRLSGGERQMLAIARALVMPSKLILLDEPFEGLAPVIVAEVIEAIEKLKHRTSILIVEHNADIVLPMADRAYVLVNGKVAFKGAAADLAADIGMKSRLLGIAQ